MINSSDYPGCILFVNDNITDNILGTLVTQLFIDEVIWYDEWLARQTNSPGWENQVRAFQMRVLVLRKYWDRTGCESADVVLYCKNGLASVEVNKLGPLGLTFPIASIHLHNLLYR
jgi:hypothetical protein